MIVKKINLEKILQSVTLGGVIVLLVIGLISGKINKYVHPRFNIALWSSVVVLIVFIGSVLLERRRCRHNMDYRHYMIYLMPILLALLFPPIAGKTDIVLAGSLTAPDVKSGIDLSGDSGAGVTDIYEDYSDVSDYLQETQDSGKAPDAGQSSQGEQGAQAGQEEILSDRSEAYQKMEQDGYYVIEDPVFGDWFMDLYDHLNDFEGEKYQFLAQVFPMEGLKENQFLAGRNFMVCCAADLTGYGFICNSEQTKELKENAWVTVKATISKCEYEGTEVPMLIDTTIEKAKAPKEEYIYYNNY